jgi:hypothetical protein
MNYQLDIVQVKSDIVQIRSDIVRWDWTLSTRRSLETRFSAKILPFLPNFDF